MNAEMLALIIGFLVNFLLLVFFVKSMRHQLGVWKPYGVAAGNEEFSEKHKKTFKWLAPVVATFLGFMWLASALMIVLYI